MESGRTHLRCEDAKEDPIEEIAHKLPTQENEDLNVLVFQSDIPKVQHYWGQMSVSCGEVNLKTHSCSTGTSMEQGQDGIRENCSKSQYMYSVASSALSTS